uniref:CUE domain containing 2 n=1 Tax=Neolamprologus brichardi TaxID=32507 RepID=A0A3Q4HMZ8_NEOBR
MDLHKIIHSALHEFIQTYITDADLSTLDDVLLSYITGVLEDLGSQQSVEENFDVEDFAEMLEAYIPGFAEIDRTEEISLKLTSLPSEPPRRETQCLKSQTEGATWEAQEQHLLEMFPKCSLTEARSALSIAKGDMEEAVRLIIEGDVQLSPTPLNFMTVLNHTRYMLVDREEDKKTHRPVVPKDVSFPLYFCFFTSNLFHASKSRLLNLKPEGKKMHYNNLI